MSLRRGRTDVDIQIHAGSFTFAQTYVYICLYEYIIFSYSFLQQVPFIILRYANGRTRLTALWLIISTSVRWRRRTLMLVFRAAASAKQSKAKAKQSNLCLARCRRCLLVFVVQSQSSSLSSNYAICLGQWAYAGIFYSRTYGE